MNRLNAIAIVLLVGGCQERATSVADSPTDSSPAPPGPPSKLATPPHNLAWFKGVDELPAEHPCHDSTSVVVYAEHRDADGKWGRTTSVASLGSLRKDPSTDWVHFGPRTVQGVRWSSPAGDFLVASCTMGGTGYRPYDPSHDEAVPEVAPTFVLGDVGEPNRIEYAEVRWMHRAPNEAWTTMREDVLWAGNDEGNDPQYTSRARVLGAVDADRDGMPEITAVTIADCHRVDKRCPASNARTPSFWATIIATEGKLGLRETVLLGPDLAEVSADPELIAAMPPEVHAQMSTAIAGERTKALDHARSVLRDASKVP